MVNATEPPYTSIEDLWRRAGISVVPLERLAGADAFGSLQISRRDALWEIKGLSDEPLPLFAAADERDLGRSMVEEYAQDGLTWTGWKRDWLPHLR